MCFNKKLLFALLRLFWVLPTCAQTIAGIQTDGSRTSNIITAVPFLSIMPQARAGAMGNAGVAIDADANASALNVSALAFLPDGSAGASVSYSPWLKSLVPDMNLAFLSGYYRVDERNTLAASFRYFSLGAVQFTDSQFQNLGVFNPNEMALDASYVRSFGPGFAIGSTLRFIYSNFYNGQFSSATEAQAGKAVSLDIAALYKKEISLFGGSAIWSAGINLSNIGTKLSYSTGGTAYFLPANFKLGTAATFLSGNGNKFILALDVNKLMVPTQPIYDGKGKISKGEDPSRSVPAGIFGSFADAPGGVGEELKEIGISTGIEYSFQEKFALRTGYNYQDPGKGNSRYLTLGAGLKYNIFTIDFAYLAASLQKSPLANTLRFSLQVRFEKMEATK
jgi:hypothetical protein